MRNPNIIGLHGGKQTGKDTIGSYLVHNHGYTRVAFADAIRESMLIVDPLVSLADAPDEVSDFFGVLQRLEALNNRLPLPSIGATPDPVRLSELVNFWGWEDAKRVPEVRRLLQCHGDGTRQILGKNAWINKTANDVHSILAQGGKVVITDVRYANEAEYILSADGVTVRVDRDDAPKGDSHISEQPIDPSLITCFIENNGTLDELHNQVEGKIFWADVTASRNSN